MAGGSKLREVIEGRNVRRAVRYLLIVALFFAVCCEGYYIFVLRDTIQRQAEDLSNISIQLQMLKSERESLSEEISSTKEKTGEGKNGDTIPR